MRLTAERIHSKIEETHLDSRTSLQHGAILNIKKSFSFLPRKLTFCNLDILLLLLFDICFGFDENYLKTKEVKQTV
jgi:hypothetical protein